MNATWWRQESPIGPLTVLAGARGVRRIELGAAAFEAGEGNGDVEITGHDLREKSPALGQHDLFDRLTSPNV